MRRALLCVVIVLGLAVAAGAVDVTLRDGTVIPAKSYTISGSYVMVTLPNGSRVAYDVADVDVEALRRAEEAATASEAQGEAAAPQGKSSAFAGAAARSTGASAMSITDRDVEHIGLPEGASGEEQKQQTGPPKGHEEGGQVLVQNLKYEKLEEGVWRVTGEVVNRMPTPVTDVRVSLEGADKERQVKGVEKAIGLLETGQKGAFQHDFKMASQPRLRVRVYWMQQSSGQPSATPPAAGSSASGSAAAGQGQPPTSASLGGRPVRPMQWGGGGYQRAGAAPTPTPTW